MKTSNGLCLQMTGVPFIAPVLAVSLFLNPLAYAAPPQSQPAYPKTQAAQSPADDNAPVPPMPPADPAQFASTPSTESPTPLTDALPDSPGAIESAQLEAQQQPAATNQAPTTSQAAQNQPSTAQAPPSSSREPLGTAAAQTVPTVGVAASRPAGAALAPAKQRRIRTILIRTGALVGAAAALGVTMALTEGSPSKPPGAH